jgi:hypothetical protein
MPTETPDEFPNNWDKISKVPIHRFVSVPFEEFMTRANGWELPSSVAGIIRIENEDGTVTEKVITSRRKLVNTVRTLEDQSTPYTAVDPTQMAFNYDVTGEG